jgi:hypothetical protein
MSRAVFKPTIPMLEWAKTFHALGRAATVIYLILIINNYLFN